MLPLAGLRVLDFSTLLPGPLATLFLAEAGAEVIKIERPGGEDMRRFPPAFGTGSAPFAALNAGKTSLAVDLKSAAGRATLRPLLEGADILVEQFRPGVMARLGLGYADVQALNPALIYCSISGYGQTGPRAGEAGHDINYQAVAGLLSLSPGTAQAPTVPPALTADIAGGAMPAVINILLALRRRDLTGEGCHLDIAMADAVFTFAGFALTEGFATGQFPGSHETMLAGGIPRYGLYATADGRFLAVGALEPKFWEAFCTGIGLDTVFRDDDQDLAATRAAIVAIVAARTAAEWAGILGPLDCCATIVASLDEAARDPHFQARGLFQARASDGSGQTIPITSLPLDKALRRPMKEVRTVPKVGKHKSDLT